MNVCFAFSSRPRRRCSARRRAPRVRSNPIRASRSRIIVPFGPGSATDTITRIIAQHLGNALNQTIVIENKPGANGAIAAA